MSGEMKESRRPIIITLSGCRELCSSLGSSLSASLSSSSVAEWRRSFGRVLKHVRLGPVVARDEHHEDDDENEEDDEQQDNVLKQPLLHTFWIECSDVETYRTSVREELLSWHKSIVSCREERTRGRCDEWLLVLVDRHELFGKKTASKLLPGRGNALSDRIKMDLTTNNNNVHNNDQVGKGGMGERVVQLVHRTKWDAKSTESWRSLVNRAQTLILNAFNHLLNGFEDRVRGERERRNSSDWHFCSFFLLQERLALLYANLHAFEEALVQYDELDALFAQFVLNSNLTDKPEWLKGFSESTPCSWSGLSLAASTTSVLRECIRRRECSLLQLRNYLFAKQCQLLLASRQAHLVLRRSLPFLHSCVDESRLLDISLPEGALASWSLLSSLQIIKLYDQACDEEKDKDDEDEDHDEVELKASDDNDLRRRARRKSFGWGQDGSVAPAALWAHAKSKLLQIGDLCGLLDPKSHVNLQRVLEITSGLQDDHLHQQEHHSNDKGTSSTPLDKLKEALASKQSFQKYYMELSELAISSYKHAGCLRFARRLGIELAQFYLQVGEVSRAVPFFLDALRTFKMETWTELELETLKQLVYCYEVLGDQEKAFKICAKIAGHDNNRINLDAKKDTECNEKYNREESNGHQSHDHDGMDERHYYHSKMLQLLPSLESKTLVELSDVLQVTNCQLLSSEPTTLVPGSELRLRLKVVNLMPKSIVLEAKKTKVAVIVCQEKQEEEEAESEKGSSRSNRRGTISGSYASSMVALHHRMELEHRSSSKASILFSARITCKNSGLVLRRKNSSGSNVLAKPTLTSSSVARADFDLLMSLEATEKDGDHTVLLPGPNELVFSVHLRQVGHYKFVQLLTRLKGGQFDLLSNLAPMKAVKVVEEEPTITLVKLDQHPEVSPARQELVAGVNEHVELIFYTGSRSFQEGTRLEMERSKGLSILVVADKDKEKFAEVTQVNIGCRGPFTTLRTPLVVRAHLPKNAPIHQTGMKKRQQSFLEHKIEIRKFWQQGEQSYESLSLHFSLPFEISCELRSSLCQKLACINVNAVKDFVLADVSLTNVEESSKAISNIRLLNSPNTITLKKGKSHVFFFDLCSPFTSSTTSSSKAADVDRDEPDLAEDPRMSSDLPEIFNAVFSFLYTPGINVISTLSGDNNETERLEMSLQLKDYKTLYVLSSRVVPVGGGELCRTGIPCSLILDIFNTSKRDEEENIMYEVLAEQGVWAVCGSASGRVVMKGAQRRVEVNVEVMPIVGGHLRLPQTRISRHIKDNNEAEYRVEPFGPGQVYNASQFVQTHVLAQLPQQQQAHHKRQARAEESKGDSLSRSGPASLP